MKTHFDIRHQSEDPRPASSIFNVGSLRSTLEPSASWGWAQRWSGGMHVPSWHRALCQGLLVCTVWLGHIKRHQGCSLLKGMLLGELDDPFAKRIMTLLCKSKLPHVRCSLPTANEVLREIKTCDRSTNIWTDGFRERARLQKFQELHQWTYLFIFFILRLNGAEQTLAACEVLSNALGQLFLMITYLTAGYGWCCWAACPALAERGLGLQGVALETTIPLWRATVD